MSQTPSIRRATVSDVPQVAGLIAVAFHDLPQSRWLVGSELLREPMLARNMAMWVGHALIHGHVEVIDRVAAAVWFNLEHDPIPLPPGYERQLDIDCGGYASRFQTFDLTLGKHHPQAPHHHLAMLAVHPEHQRRGLGAALLRHHQDKLDTAGIPAFLEASTPESVGLYNRHGYQPLGEPYRLPEDGPCMWPMWRDPVA